VASELSGTPEPKPGSRMFYALYEEYRQASGAGSWEDWLAQRPPKLPAFPFDETETGNDDVFRSQVMPGLVVCATWSRISPMAGCRRSGWSALSLMRRCARCASCMPAS